MKNSFRCTINFFHIYKPSSAVALERRKFTLRLKWLHIYIYTNDKTTDQTRSRFHDGEEALKYNTRLPLRERFSGVHQFHFLCGDCSVLAGVHFSQKVWLFVITGAWLCKVGSVSCDQVSSVCASGRYSLPADGAQKCFAPQGWPACLLGPALI